MHDLTRGNLAVEHFLLLSAVYLELSPAPFTVRKVRSRTTGPDQPPHRIPLGSGRMEPAMVSNHA